MWRAAKRLAQAASDSEGRWSYLRRLLSQIDWLSPSAPVRAKELVLTAGTELLEEGQRLAEALNLPVATVLRNLAILAPATALPIHRLAWRVALASGES